MAIQHSRQFRPSGFTDYAQDHDPEKAVPVNTYVDGQRTQVQSRPTVQVGVTRSSDTYTYNDNAVGDHNARMSPEKGGWAGRHTFGYFPPEKGQGELFSVEHEAPHLDVLFAHHDMRHLVPGALGKAALETHARYGEYPKASNDLSPHSEKLVRRLSEKGVIQYPENLAYPDLQNGISDEDSYYHDYQQTEPRDLDGYGGGTNTHKVPDWHQNLGSQFIRHAIRPDRKQQSLEDPPTLF
jgi:hypothetical protein